MAIPDNWRKSSYSGGDDGNNCVEIANRDTCIAVRDSKTPARATLTFPTRAFTTFVEALKDTLDNWRKSSYSGPDDGNECVAIANSPTHVAVRDSKTPARTPSPSRPEPSPPSSQP